MKVELIAYTPNPDDVCARGAGTCVNRGIPAKGRETALRRALESGHESVAEHAVFTFAVEGISRVAETQLVRHRLASYSIQSGRYCARNPLDYEVPEDCLFDWDMMDDAVTDFDHALMHLDEIMKDLGIKEEDRRYFYPQGLRTNIVVTMNARELRHFFNLRCCWRSQWEIRELADRMLALCKEVAPVLFADSGPPCRTGRCPEATPCGRPR